MKILYAVGNRKGGQLQLARFLPTFDGQIKLAGFNASCPGFNLDWTLDALQNMFNTSHVSFDNDNLRTYCEQVASYGPDLIISDLELFTSYIGIQLNIPVWQVSPALLYYGMSQQEKINANIYRHYSYLFNRQNMGDDILQNILVNSDKKFVYSHFGDTGKIKLNEGYQWLRPYTITGKISVPCRHHVFASVLQNDKKFVNYLKSFQDVVLFSGSLDEHFPGMTLKDITNLSEYGCNLKNCNIGATQGYTDLLADLYYSGKYSLIMPDFTQAECVVNAMVSDNLGLGKVIFQNESFKPVDLVPTIDSHINLLHDEIRKL